MLVKQRHSNSFEQRDSDPESGIEQGVLGEVYTSEVFLEEEARVRALPRNPADGPEVKYVPFAMLLKRHLTITNMYTYSAAVL